MVDFTWDTEKGAGHTERRRVHLVGIGGVGMAGLAYLLKEQGYEVSGCDRARNLYTEWLQAQRVSVSYGHGALHAKGTLYAFVRSAAVAEDLEELELARKRGIPVFVRGQVLASILSTHQTSIAVGGTHGKTTTSALLVQLLRSCGRDVSFCVGGVAPGLGSIAGTGDGSLLVVEADESDGTLVGYHPSVAVVTNIDFDHAEHFYGSEAYDKCFQQFVEQAKELVVYPADQECCFSCARVPRRLSFGLNPNADVRGQILEVGARSSRMLLNYGGKILGELTVPLPGQHNVQNALAVCAVALHLGIPFSEMEKNFGTLSGVDRRFEVCYEADELVVVTDYAHHPSEIKALISTAKQWKRRRILAVFQPHRYSRTLALGSQFPPAFRGVNELIVLPVYAASEKPIEGGRSKDLLRLFRAFGGYEVAWTSSFAQARSYLSEHLQHGDLLLLVGAGDIEHLWDGVRQDLMTQTQGIGASGLSP